MVPNGSAATAEILKSPQDKRLYRRVVLANGLEALLISDPEMAHSLAEDEQTGEHEDADNEDDDIDNEVLLAAKNGRTTDHLGKTASQRQIASHHNMQRECKPANWLTVPVVGVHVAAHALV
jgi:hypothetical protein